MPIEDTGKYCVVLDNRILVLLRECPLSKMLKGRHTLKRQMRMETIHQVKEALEGGAVFHWQS